MKKAGHVKSIYISNLWGIIEDLILSNKTTIFIFRNFVLNYVVCSGNITFDGIMNKK